MSAGGLQANGATVPPTIWNVPLERNTYFAGREKQLTALRDCLTLPDPMQRTQVIYGPGGMGKTQVALQYAYRHRGDYAIIWWIRAQDSTTLLGDLLGLSNHLGIAGAKDRSPELLADVIRRELDRRNDWLLVFDHAAAPSAISQYLPQGRTGHVIITSRNATWRGVARPIALEEWDTQQAVEFLHKRIESAAGGEAAEGLATAMKGLPLALELAGAYIKQSQVSFADYLDGYAQHAPTVVVGEGKDYPASVAAAWDLSFGRLHSLSPAACDLLGLMASLSPDEIRCDLLTGARRLLPQPLAELVAEPSNFDSGIALLASFSLVALCGPALCMDRLLATVTRDRLESSDRRRWAEVALRLVNAAFTFESTDVSTWARCAALMPHVITVTDNAQQLAVASDVASSLLNEAGRYLLKNGHFTQARSVFDRAAALARATYGEKHPAVSAIVNNLGRVQMRLGNLTEAQRCFELALAIDEPTYGHDHPHVATLVNNYGSCLMAAGNAESARQQFQWALAVYEKHHGPSHAKVASVVNNLAYAMQALGDLAGARNNYKRALSIAESTVGKMHPTVASILHNLGMVLRSMGDLTAARADLERAAAIDQAAYGPTHPDVVRDIDHLGEVLRELGDVHSARSHYQKALTNVKRLHGGNHPRALQLQKAIEGLG